ncbi:MAG: 30S ribosomal protein S17 [Nitrososphaerota archaeon]|jgi:small subunit ribosomal protein S17|nr:30S ribosomal protein S17 [Nitrososphaerota archaeon]MDG6922535.1 30S ribosomal protein S17 [Nitrososphaerota archaeon]
MSQARNIGISVKSPERQCSDPNCPFHGTLRIRGKLLSGKVSSVSAKNMAVIQRESTQFTNKYLRYLKKRHTLHAHLPPCLDLSVGEIATVAECKPISKTVSFVVVGIERESAKDAPTKKS